MVVGILELTMTVPACTLKEKRSVVRRIIGRTRQRFPVSIGEVAEQDTLSTLVIGIAFVASESKIVEKTLTKVEHYIEELMLAEPFDRFVRLEYY